MTLCTLDAHTVGQGAFQRHQGTFQRLYRLACRRWRKRLHQSDSGESGGAKAECGGDQQRLLQQLQGATGQQGAHAHGLHKVHSTQDKVITWTNKHQIWDNGVLPGHDMI